jgi:chitin deacetylase
MDFSVVTAVPRPRSVHLVSAPQQRALQSLTLAAAWTATFPNQPPGTPAPAAGMPQAWTDALNAAVSAGKIPSFPPATIQNGGNPTYAAGNDPNNQQTVCSATYGCRIPGDIWDAPDGVMGVSFDDGPLPVRQHARRRLRRQTNLFRQGSSDKLYNFLQNQTQKATHFMIGVNIMQNQPQFNMAFKTLQDDIAVHTWSHPSVLTVLTT